MRTPLYVSGTVGVGGRCDVRETWNSEFRVLELTVTATDSQREPPVYYYPYIRGDTTGPEGMAGLGYVDVPADAAEGTVVVTDTLNGCAVRVFRNESNDFVFIMI